MEELRTLAKGVRATTAVNTDTPSQRAEHAVSEGMLMLKMREFASAERHFRRAVEMDPQLAIAHLRLAMALSGPDRTHEAILAAEEAIRLDPSLTVGYGILSGLYQRLGKFDQAIAVAEQAIQWDPGAIPAYADVVRCKRIGPDDRPFVAKIQGLLGQEHLKPAERMVLEFALGKAHDDLEEYKLALHHFTEANELGLRLFGAKLGYDQRAVEQETEFLVRIYTRQFLEDRRDLGLDSEAPVFIVGMIRSGTTLLDSLLSQHKRIGSAGELKYWDLQSTKPLKSDQDLRDRATQFVEGLKLVGDYARVIDKYPLNYRHIGLIHAALPQASFIHLRRNRADTCLSIYTTEFGAGAPRFAYSKPNIAHAYDSYLRLMDHWRQTLPESRLYELDYESLVASPEVTLRGIVDFLGLDWQARLGEERNTTAEVLTPSRWQVRQPLYRSSVGRASKYPPGLFSTP